MRKISFYPLFFFFSNLNLHHSNIDLILHDCKTSEGTNVSLPSHVCRSYYTSFCERVCGRNAFWHLRNYANMNSELFALIENNFFFFHCVHTYYTQHLQQLTFLKGQVSKGTPSQSPSRVTSSHCLYISKASARIVSLLSTSDHRGNTVAKSRRGALTSGQ